MRILWHLMDIRRSLAYFHMIFMFFIFNWNSSVRIASTDTTCVIHLRAYQSTKNNNKNGRPINIRSFPTVCRIENCKSNLFVKKSIEISSVKRPTARAKERQPNANMLKWIYKYVSIHFTRSMKKCQKSCFFSFSLFVSNLIERIDQFPIELWR